MKYIINYRDKNLILDCFIFRGHLLFASACFKLWRLLKTMALDMIDVIVQVCSWLLQFAQ